MSGIDYGSCHPTGRVYPGLGQSDPVWLGMPIAFVDVETTGRDSTVDRVIELAVTGAIERVWRVNPCMLIPAEASAVNGLYDADVAGLGRFSEIAEEFVTATDGCVLAAYNAPFDKAFIAAELFRAGFVLPDTEWLDPLVLVREFQRYKKGKKLGQVAERMSIPHEHAHSAQSDARTGLAILRELGRDVRCPPGLRAFVARQHEWREAQEIDFEAWKARHPL